MMYNGSRSWWSALRKPSGQPLWPSKLVLGNSRYASSFDGSLDRARSADSEINFTANQPAHAPPSMPT